MCAMQSESDLIRSFLDCDAFAVVGASDDSQEYGAKVFACYRQNGSQAYPVNPVGKRCKARRVTRP